MRSTNVYEEKTLGIFADCDSIDEDGFLSEDRNRATVFGQYLGMHIRKQLSFGMRRSSV